MIETDFSKRYFSDAELALIGRNPGFQRAGQKCPVCLGEGRFSYKGVEYECPDDDYGHVTLRKAKLYWLHNIPLEYQQLLWEEWVEETGDRETFEQVNLYIDSYERYALNGVGMTFYSKGLGTGKTWAATATLKQLVKKGEDGWFAPFYEVAGYYEIVDPEERAYKIRRVQEAGVLVLDEIRRPISEKQKNLLGEKLENLIRPRAANNLPTIITTNLTPNEIEDLYPRAFSLIYAKNIEFELSGTDARLTNKVTKRLIESVANGEALPIT